MAVQYFVRCGGSGPHVLAGFESGHLVHWDTRNPTVVVSSIKLYDEPGVHGPACVHARVRETVYTTGFPLSISRVNAMSIYCSS